MTDLGRVLGSYRLVSLLAEGGMSRIYLGAHTRLKRTAAIKVLKPALQHRPDAVARFFEEARAINRIRHPNVIESIDLVEDPDAAYCVLELLDGPSLARRLAAGRIPLASTIRIGIQIADALASVHAHAIVHRDLKPENLILVERDGRDDFVKLIDFGVAQMGDGDLAGLPFGTAAYMAPEQAAGERVDGRADIYALGVLLFEMATGAHPFPSASDSEFTLRHADEVPAVPSKRDPAIPRGLDAVILRCLEKDPADRYPAAASVAAALRVLENPPRSRRITPFVIAAAALASAGIVVALAVTRDEPRAAPVAPVVAAAAAPAPASPPPIAAPAMVTLTFRSTPPGARVYRLGETVALGITPFATTLRAGAALPVRFQLAGHLTRETVASLAESTTIAVTLEKLPVRARSKPAQTQSLQREGVMDPFADE